MKSFVRTLLIICICLNKQKIILAQGLVYGQPIYSPGTPPFVSAPGKVTFRTVIAGFDKNKYTVQDMVKINVASLFNPNAGFEEYILARAIESSKSGSVQLKVYAYDPSKPNFTGNLIFQLDGITNDASGFKTIGKPIMIKSSFLNSNVLSDNIKVLAQDAFPELGNPALCTISPSKINSFKMALASTGTKKIDLEYTEKTIYQCSRGQNYDNEQPVIIEVIAENVEISSIAIPGLQSTFNLNDYFNPESDFTFHVMVNGIEKTVQQWRTQGDNVPVIDMKLGDDVSFKVVDNTSSATSDSYTPKVTGIPAVWVAPFAGDLMFYCSPSLRPGEFNPWIGFDTRVHTLMLRKYPDNFQLQVPNWVKVDGIPRAYMFNWTAQRHMDASKDKYVAAHTWVKYKALKNGVYQRNNQKEGLNLTFLNFWHNWLTSNYKNYDGHIQYMMGFDEDELMLMNDPDRRAEGNTPPWGPGGGILKLEKSPWQEMPEGRDQLYNPVTGNPAEGFPLNIMIDAYRKNREAVVNNNPGYNDQYAGYEIQDNGTDEKHPDGTSTGNDAAPGLVTIRSAGGRFLKVKFNVTSPLTTDYGFYGSLRGTRWPAYQEQNVPYTLAGLKGLSLSELEKFSMSYSIQGRVGDIQEATVYFKDVSEDEKKKTLLTGEWTHLWNLGFPAYAWMTAYYQRTPSSQKVMVAGKELKQIFLLFYNEKGIKDQLNLNQTGGGGFKVWLGDFRQKREGIYTVERTFANKIMYTSPYYRNYVITPGTTLRFEVLDGDPYTFMNPYMEWYLGSRAMAKRIPYDSLDGKVDGKQVAEPFLKAYVKPTSSNTWNPISEAFDSIYFTNTFSKPGDYDLKVLYRNTSSVRDMIHHIQVVNYPSPNLGKVSFRAANDKERKFLELPDNIIYWVFTTDSIYSKYTYVEGPRANNPPNRWAEYNDYNGLYNLSVNNPQIRKEIQIAQDWHINFWLKTYDISIRKKWFWPNWANHYSSNWATVNPTTGLQGLPSYVDSKFVTRVYLPGDEIDPWNSYMKQNFFTDRTNFAWEYVVPLISYTDHQGYRMRTNPSCIYQIAQVFDNKVGAFSGNPNVNNPDYITAPDISDDYKDQQDLYYGLSSGKIIIVNNIALLLALRQIGWNTQQPDFIIKVQSPNDPKLAINEVVYWPSNQKRKSK